MKDLAEEVERLRSAIRRHRDQRGDDRCWLDDEELYKVLPEGYAPPQRGEAVELSLCQRFIETRHHHGTEYVSPQRRVEELEAELAELRAAVDTLPQVWQDDVADEIAKMRERKRAETQADITRRLEQENALPKEKVQTLADDLKLANDTLEDVRSCAEDRLTPD